MEISRKQMYICDMRKYKSKRKIKETCSKCNNPLETNRIGKQCYCTSCHAEYMRNNRPIHSTLSVEQKQKANARSYLNVYIRRGKISKLPCSICGDTQSEAHHNDYTKPLEVIWFCRKHHLEHHNKKRIALYSLIFVICTYIIYIELFSKF
jgi:hypothetical protein